MDCASILLTGHAVQRIFERGISRQAVTETIAIGEVVADYAQDRPYPSCLLLGYPSGEPLHVVVAREAQTGHCYVLTAYKPDPAKWAKGYKTRRHP